MNALFSILAATLAGGLLSVCLAALLSFRMSQRMSQQLVAFAAGVMLSAACLDILPEALQGFAQAAPTEAAGSHAHPLFITLLAGIVAFFGLERLALWRHAHPGGRHGQQENERARNAASLVLVGDACHNFVDGVLIAAAFLADPALGYGTTLAIIAHEIPQELGDFVILLNAGWKKPQALLANVLSSLTAMLGQCSQLKPPYMPNADAA